MNKVQWQPKHRQYEQVLATGYVISFLQYPSFTGLISSSVSHICQQTQAYTLHKNYNKKTVQCQCSTQPNKFLIWSLEPFKVQPNPLLMCRVVTCYSFTGNTFTSKHSL